MNLNVNSHDAMSVAMDSTGLNILLYILPFYFF